MMNERFRELAEQSGAQFFPAMTDYFGDTHPSGVLTVKVDLEKFAELIIQQCVKSVEQTPFGYKDYRIQIEEDMRTECAESIRNHFGVEL